MIRLLLSLKLYRLEDALRSNICCRYLLVCLQMLSFCGRLSLLKSAWGGPPVGIIISVCSCQGCSSRRWVFMVTKKTHTMDADTVSAAETDHQTLGGLDMVSMVIRGDALLYWHKGVWKKKKTKGESFTPWTVVTGGKGKAANQHLSSLKKSIISKLSEIGEKRQTQNFALERRILLNSCFPRGFRCSVHTLYSPVETQTSR